MNMLTIILKEIKQQLRDRRTMVIMILFPMALMSILGMALSRSFEGDAAISVKSSILYTSTSNGALSQGFNEFEKAMSGMGITFTETDDINKGKDSIKDVKYSCYILLDENNKTIELYKNDRYNFQADLIENALRIFVQKANTMGEIVKYNPSAITKPGNSNADTVSVVSLEKGKTPRAKDYYAVTMLTLIIMYSAQVGAFTISGERHIKTADRISVSPVRRYEFFAGKVLGCLIVTMLQMALVILFSKYILKAYWGDNILQCLMIVGSEILMAVSMGIGVGFIIKTDTAISGILNALIPFVVFLGGGYIPLEQFGNSFINQLAQISPLKWTNEAIFNIIYSNSFRLAANAVLVNLAIALIFLIVSSIFVRKEAI